MTRDWIVMVISSNFSSRVLSSVSRPWERLHTGGNNQGHYSKADIINVFQHYDFMITFFSISVPVMVRMAPPSTTALLM